MLVVRPDQAIPVAPPAHHAGHLSARCLDC
jgi:hypothetical protein